MITTPVVHVFLGKTLSDLFATFYATLLTTLFLTFYASLLTTLLLTKVHDDLMITTPVVHVFLRNFSSSDLFATFYAT